MHTTTLHASPPARRFIALMMLVYCAFVSTSRGAEAARRPNIVFVIADDLGYRDIGAFGQDKIRTPNIDRLASEGVRLTTHYSGNAVCAPSRCVLLSGLHPGHAFVRSNGNPPNYVRGTSTEGQNDVPSGHLQLPATLKKLGYSTGGFGKWGLGTWGGTGNPNLQGVDRFFGYICQGVAHNYYPAYLWDNGKLLPQRNPAPDLNPRLADGADSNDPASYERFRNQSDFAPDVITEQALQFVRENKDRPFFLYYPTIVPHLGYQVPDDSLAEYQGAFPEEPYLGRGAYYPQRTPRATYAAMITRLDREVGRLASLVSELGLDDNTIFVFTSDNGAPGGIPTSYFNSGGVFRGSKGTIYEGGFRVPAIVRWKGKVAAGGQSDRVTGFEDWLPTLIELVGARDQIPSSIDGISFASTLLGQQQAERSFLYREYPRGGQFVRAGNWRLIRKDAARDGQDRGGSNRQEAASRPAFQRETQRNPGAADPENTERVEFELYDLATDPSEQRNVALQHPDVVAKLSKILQEQHVPSERYPLGIDRPAN